MCISKGDNRRHIALHAERDRRRGAPTRLAPRALRPRGQRRLRGARRRCRAGGDGVRDRARPAGDAQGAAGRRRRRGGRHHALDPAAAGPRGVGEAPGMAAGPARPAPERRDRDRGADGCRRRAGGRRRHRGRRDRSALGHRRPERCHPRPDPGRRRLARPRPHARAGHARRRAAATRVARGRLRLRGLLHGRGDGGASGPRGPHGRGS